MPQISDRRQIQTTLEKNRPWTAYALADLEPGYFENASWFCGANGGGLTLVYHGYSRPLIFCIDKSGDSESVFDEIDGTLSASERYVVVEPENLPLIRSRYRIQDERPTFRMTLDAGHFRPAAAGKVQRLAAEHSRAVADLYRQERPEFFLDSMLRDGVYFGAFEGTDLVAIAGTHVLSSEYSVAGLGNIYTRPDRRSLGYSSIVTSAVCSELLRLGIATIVLNVREENAPAIRVYARLGLQTHCRYFELVASLQVS